MVRIAYAAIVGVRARRPRPRLRSGSRRQASGKRSVAGQAVPLSGRPTGPRPAGQSASAAPVNVAASLVARRLRPMVWLPADSTSEASWRVPEDR